MPELPEPAALFPEFKASTAADWIAKVRQDLNGENPDQLLWHSPAGITVKPCYHPEDAANQPWTFATPGQFPFVRGNKTKSNHWELIQTIAVGQDTAAAVDKGVQALAEGADGLHFVIQQAKLFDFAYLVQKIDYARVAVSFTLSDRPAAFLAAYYHQLQASGVAVGQVKGFVHYKPEIAHENYTSTYFDELAELLQLTQNSPELQSLSVDGAYFAVKGGNIIQEIAFTISVAVAYLDALTERGFTPETVARQMQFLVATGTDYFFEIAKLRAIQVLWATIVTSYGLAPEVAAHLRLHSQTSRWYQTTFDPYTNLLRTTTETMAAVIGGCHSLCIASFDSTIRPENNSSERLARNISLILKEEAYLHQSIDPAGGSYYLEALTQQLAQEAWQLFQSTESQGGFVAAWQHHTVQDALNAVAQQKFKKIAAGETVLVGTNKFINSQEQFDYNPEELIQSKNFDTNRGAYSLEVMRFAVELHFRKRRQRPKAVVVSIGETIQRHIHASFAKEFFGCAGFQTEVQQFHSVAQAIEALQTISGQVIVLSSSTEEYQSFAQQLGPILKSHKDQPAVILAANPQHMKAELKEQGFDEFIFQGCDTAAIVSRIQEKLQKE
ncbi:methylmalonyl-CoA mutase family protein [Adhaeribacter pallidiroseus]|uniref:Methylmalonyl-CoA mutase n=1 Tax=Adhaeribacter pallidiroseus TaxID=2072847 RepID=A0A369QP94_9BACT|nr:methylmalonyl-CoA mutase family protein [Adhaeribacter pallidiroseus]RDC66544.1 Methylmalonyl-CoA mutase [Adhaeribacter pallidiroseus]